MSKETQAKKTTTKAKKAPAKTKTSAPKEGWFAVFATGGKQYKVSNGDTVKVEKIKGEHKVGDTLVFNEVLLFDDGKGNTTIGTPLISGSKVEGTLVKIGRNAKVTTIKYKQKSRYFKKYGHKQPYFQVKINSVK